MESDLCESKSTWVSKKVEAGKRKTIICVFVFLFLFVFSYMSCVLFCGVGLIHWVCTYAGAYAWAPLSSKCLRERFSLLGAYAGCLRRVLSPTLVTSGDSKRAI